jgi:hypothetical protein
MRLSTRNWPITRVCPPHRRSYGDPSLSRGGSREQQICNIGACNQKRKQDVTSPDRVANLYRVSVSTKVLWTACHQAAQRPGLEHKHIHPHANDASKR